jgi:hypothetical protein
MAAFFFGKEETTNGISVRSQAKPGYWLPATGYRLFPGDYWLPPGHDTRE